MPLDDLAPPYDYVVACDCVYVERLVDSLVWSMGQTSGRGTTLLVASEKREEVTYARFRERLAEDFAVRQAPRRHMDKMYDHENSEVLVCKLRRRGNGGGSGKGARGTGLPVIEAGVIGVGAPVGRIGGRDEGPEVCVLSGGAAGVECAVEPEPARVAVSVEAKAVEADSVGVVDSSGGARDTAVLLRGEEEPLPSADSARERPAPQQPPSSFAVAEEADAERDEVVGGVLPVVVEVPDVADGLSLVGVSLCSTSSGGVAGGDGCAHPRVVASADGGGGSLR